jgi:hypothetical protein
MQRVFLFLSFLFVLIITSCKKENSCGRCIGNNQPPVARAGPDQIIALPTDSVLLDGSASNDPDGKISEWLWTKISGPAFFNIVNKESSKTVIKSLVAGTYQFELKVTDVGGLFSKDTVGIEVAAALAGSQIVYQGIWGCNDLCTDGDVYWTSPNNFYSNQDIPLEVAIKLDTSSTWIEVRKYNSPLPSINQFYWQVDRGYLWVFAYEGRLIGKQVTVSVKFL